MMRKYLYAIPFVVAGLVATAFGQTVTVDASNGSPDGTTTFNSLQLALNSFKAGGTNAGNVAANIINITVAGGALDEQVTVTDTGGAMEEVTVNAVGGQAVLRVRAGSLAGNDGFQLSTDATMTFNDIAFVPSATTTPADDLIYFLPVSKNATTKTFNRCVFTAANASGNPVVTSKATALVNNLASVVTNIGDDIVASGSFAPASVADNSRYVFNDCVFSHTKTDAGRDGIVDVSNGGGASPGWVVNSCVFSYCSRYGIQFAGNGDSTAGANSTWKITGTPENPSIFANLLRAGQSFLGPQVGRLQLENTIAINCTERAWSLDSELHPDYVENCAVINTPVGFVFDNLNPTTTNINKLTMVNAAQGFLLSNTRTGNVVNVTNSVFSDSDANDVVIASFGAGATTWAVNISNSAVVTQAGDNVAGYGTTAYEIIGSGVIGTPAPAYASTTLSLPSIGDFYRPTGSGYSAFGARFQAADVSDWSVQVY